MKYLRDKGASVRLGLPQDGKQEMEVCFDSDRYWEAKKVQAIYKRVEQSGALIKKSRKTMWDRLAPVTRFFGKSSARRATA